MNRMETFRREMAEDRRKERAAVARFVAAVASADRKGIVDSIGPLEDLGQWRAALRAITRLPPPPLEARRTFRQVVWMNCGDSLRSQVGDDLVLIKGLRLLMPRCTGPAVVIYRGEGAWNCRRRTYGVSWSLREDVADHHARRSEWRSSKGGSVVLCAHAPAAAIIAKIPKAEDRYAEAEVLIDRRMLGRVKVLRRYPELPRASR
jgi:hypothetical protein